MPGVIVQTQTLSGPSTPLRAPDGQFFVVGLAERGPTNAVFPLRGMPDYTRYYGDRVSYGALYDQLLTYFNEGGQQAYVARVVGPAATVGSLTLLDQAGSPLNTIRVDAANAGSWSTQLSVEIQAGSLTNTFRMIVTLNGVQVHNVNNISSPSDAVNQFATSPYIKVTNLGSATAAPANNPDVVAATALSAGADDRTSATDTTFVNALALFNYELGDGSVAIPGKAATAIWTGINAHCVANNRIGLLAAVQSETKSNLLNRVAEVDSEYCGLFAPWIRISDGAGSYRTISPEGYVAACRAKAHDQTGPWRVPAGSLSSANTLVGLDVIYTRQDSQDLDDGRVNVIKTVANTIRLYGWRSLSSSDEYKLLHNRDLLNYLVVQAQAKLEDSLFKPIDGKGQLLNAVNASIVGLVDPIARAGGLYALLDPTGKQVDPGYKVVTDNSVNTPALLALNQIAARLLVRISPVGALITLTIVKVNNQAGF